MVRFCCFCNAVNDSGWFCTIDGIDHLPVFHADTESADRTLWCIVVHRNIPVGQKNPEIFFLIQCISESFPQFSVPTSLSCCFRYTTKHLPVVLQPPDAEQAFLLMKILWVFLPPGRLPRSALWSGTKRTISGFPDELLFQTVKWNRVYILSIHDSCSERRWDRACVEQALWMRRLFAALVTLSRKVFWSQYEWF